MTGAEKKSVAGDAGGDALVILLHRGGEFLVPKGATTLQAGDSVLVLALGDDLRAVQTKLGHQGVVRAALGPPGRRRKAAAR